MKLLKARSDPSRPGFSSKKTESPSQIFAREREQADALNGMLPGMGCARLDIDYELTQPINHALLPIAQKKSKKHHKKP